MSDENKTPHFPFYTGFANPEHQMRHFTVSGEGEIIEASAEHATKPGLADLLMQVWAEDSENAIAVYRQIGEHFGFKAGDDIKLMESVASTPTTGRPSGYNLKFTARG